MLRRNGLIWIIALLIAAAVSGCGSSRNSTRASHRPTVSRPGAAEPPQRVVVKNDMPGPTRLLLSEAGSWLGTRYRYGGNDRDGVDCSGLVAQVYGRALNIKLPRTSAQQSDFCSPVSRDLIAPGDLVFFSSGGRIGHVGIYLGDGNMIHASTSRGVVVTPLSSPYFADRFCGAGRVDKYYAMAAADSRPSAPPPVVAPTAVRKATPAASAVAAPAPASESVAIIDDFFD